MSMHCTAPRTAMSSDTESEHEYVDRSPASPARAVAAAASASPAKHKAKPVKAKVVSAAHAVEALPWDALPVPHVAPRSLVFKPNVPEPTMTRVKREPMQV